MLWLELAGAYLAGIVTVLAMIAAGAVLMRRRLRSRTSSWKITSATPGVLFGDGTNTSTSSIPMRRR